MGGYSQGRAQAGRRSTVAAKHNRQNEHRITLNLGYPLTLPELANPNSLWGIDVLVDSRRIVPVAFSAQQAREIARRIIDFYGPEENDHAKTD